MSDITQELVEPAVEEQELGKDDPLVLKAREKIRLQRIQLAKRLTVVLLVLGSVITGMYFFFLHVFGININPFGSSYEDVDVVAQGASLAFAFIAIYLLQALTLNMVPGTSTLFMTGVAFTLFDGNNNFLFMYMIAICASISAGILLYFLGRFAGRPVLYWLFGKEKLDKRLDWFARNGARGVPWLFLVPFFPTDLICVTCGASKMKFWQFVLIVVVFRPIEVALLMVYRLVIESDLLTDMDPIVAILSINVIIINIALLFVYHRALLAFFDKTFNFRKREKALLKRMVAQEVAKEREWAESNNKPEPEIEDHIAPILEPEKGRRRRRARA